MCVSQRHQESNGVGHHYVKRLTSHAHDITNSDPNSNPYNALLLAITGSVFHDTIWNQIIASDVISNTQILICFGLDW